MNVLDVESTRNRAETFIKNFARLTSSPNMYYRRLAVVGRTWETGPFDEDEQDLIKRAKHWVGWKPTQCFKNCQCSIIHDADCDGFQYAEGYLAPEKLGGIAIEHAWLILNDKVVETCSNVEAGAHYFGLTVEPDMVRAFLLEGQIHDAMLQDFYLDYKYTKQLLQVEL